MYSQVVWSPFPKRGVLQRVGTIILYFRGEELHVWHLILSVNLCFTRIWYMVEHALASNEILIDIFPNMVYREVFLGHPQNRWLLTTRKGI